MESLNVEQVPLEFGLIALFEGVLFLFYLLAKKKLTKSRFFRFLGILGLGISSSFMPFGLFGVMMGFPSVFICSILVSLLLDKEQA